METYRACIVFFFCSSKPIRSLKICDDKVGVKSCSCVLVVVCDGKSNLKIISYPMDVDLEYAPGIRS
ncbi:hypothetical protein HID58_094830 [Brassica napus]|uniref:Uncharacterized protein n=1 Tax=Brassica napus TaxID=3708 RepID=A0ABQ7X5X8_BRANA|nr:hypothetical protein HID58_094830 [Brassica napus]